MTELSKIKPSIDAFMQMIVLKDFGFVCSELEKLEKAEAMAMTAKIMERCWGQHRPDSRISYAYLATLFADELRRRANA